jgi:spermidine synthase
VQKKQAASAEQPISAGLRAYLYFTAAMTGAAIMVVEILGAKMLAPYVGTSHFVWTAQIAVTLVALAAGYYAGGLLADRSPKLRRLYLGIVIAGVYLLATIPLVESVAYACLRFRPAAGSLLSSTFLFFVPLALLAMVGPFFVRALTTSVFGVGGNVGRLTAISTMGSFAGTILISYFLIAVLPNSTTMYLTATVLFAVAGGFFFGWERSRRTRFAVAAVILLAAVLGYAGLRQNVKTGYDTVNEVYRRNSDFGLLQVIERKDGLARFYLNDFLVQNTYDPNEKKSTSLFTYMLHGLAHGYTPQLEDALCIGLGIGIVPMQFARDGVRVDVVEINPDSIEVATRFFDCDLSRFNLFIGDGRYFLNRAEKKYDTVILDAFLGDSSPSHLMTREAFLSVRRVLKPNGTLVINSFGDFAPGRDFFATSLSKTLMSVFRSVRIHQAGNGNVFYVASENPELTLLRGYDLAEVHFHARERVREAFIQLTEANPKRGIVLTDDYNPVDFYDAANREENRRRLALGMQQM